MKYVFIGLIRVYQFLISPLLPPNTCRFYPTCSEYSIEAYRTFGILKGTWKSVGRLLRCHPFHPGGYDPVIPDHEHTAECGSHVLEENKT
jgi:uncharacterized protein